MMITLKTLCQVTAQEVFDQVARHLLQQNQVSQGKRGDCMYRAYLDNDVVLKCAAGCLIADDEYLPIMDTASSGTSWDSLIQDDLVPSCHAELIMQLQNLHDTVEPDKWLMRLEFLASEWGLHLNTVLEVETNYTNQPF